MLEVLIRPRELPKLPKDIFLGDADSVATTEAKPTVPIPGEPCSFMNPRHDIPIQA